MGISQDRQTFLAQVAVDSLYFDDLVDFTDEDAAMRAAQRVIANWVKQEEEIAALAHQKIKSLKRQVIEGSPEYEILFKKYCEEERGRRGNR